MDVTSRRLAALFVVGLVALFPPLLGMCNRPGSLLGIPILPLYLFAVWTVLVVVGWALTRGEEP
jgi:type IV secretory pathway VirB3-like protein